MGRARESSFFTACLLPEMFFGSDFTDIMNQPRLNLLSLDIYRKLNKRLRLKFVFTCIFF